jgi:hypothetical protein
MKVTGLKTFLAAITLTAGLTACHSYANDNTSRPCIANANGKKVGNDQIEENRPMGNDANPKNRMWDGYTSPEERIGDTKECCEKHEEKEVNSGHNEH